MRDQLLAAVVARLERIEATEDPALAWEPGAFEEARCLAEILRDDDGDIEALLALGWFYWYGYLALPEGQKRDVLRGAVQVLTPCFIAGVGQLPEPLLPLLAENATSMALTLLQEAMNSRNLVLITSAVSVWQRILNATPADHSNRVRYLLNLGAALQVRFGQVGRQADLDEAIRVSRAALAATPDGHPDRAMYLSNVGAVLAVRFERTGGLVDLNEAITLTRAAVTAAPADHPDRAMYLSNLGAVLQLRFERTGTQADLNEAITLTRAAVAAAPDNHPKRAGWLSNLGNALRIRFEWSGTQADLDEAIHVGRLAVATVPADHPDRAMYLSNLGAALRIRFERTGALADLDKAIDMGRLAVTAAPDNHPKRAGWLSNLGAALRVWFVRAGAKADLTDLDEAIDMGRLAVTAAPVDHPDRAMYLSNLGAALWVRFEHAGALADLDEAIVVGREAVAASPDDRPSRATYLSNLGRALLRRFERAGVQADLDTAIRTYIQAGEAHSGAASVRIRAVQLAASLCAQTDAQTSANLFEKAVRLLPETAPRQLHRGDQHYALGQFSGLASDAAALVLRANTPSPSAENPATRALRLLELGRGVLLSQALDTRSDLTDLHARHPALAARFIELRDQLDQPADTSAPADATGMTAEWGKRRVPDRHQLAAAFAATVADIRSRDGFQTFLLPPEPAQLLRHAEHGPVVVVNVSRYRSDALLLTPDGITSIPLPDLTQDALIDRIASFQQALSAAHDPDASADKQKDAQDTLSAVLEWLWDAAARPILEELGYQHPPPPGTLWPRLWWIPGGLLGLLPLHAAGYHRQPPGPDGDRHTVMDRVISSYTPTMRALGYAREHNNITPAADQRALIVAMPTTPGITSPLRHVADEAKLVRTRLPSSTLLIEDPATATAQLPTRATVLAHLDKCAIAHFACHGSSHPSDPSQSLLLLHDHQTDPLTVASLASIRLDHARLAYLSACHTAFNSSTELIDEAIHLTTAFQLVGYPQVVGTLWEIHDTLAIRVADAFYTTLTTGSTTIDTTGAAQALHHAVRTIRNRLPERPSLWAAYLHAGA